mgnify:CR=1 FL=1|jgi:hypothetical protein
MDPKIQHGAGPVSTSILRSIDSSINILIACIDFFLDGLFIYGVASFQLHTARDNGALGG